MSSPFASPAMPLLGYEVRPWIQLTRIQKYGGVLLLFWPFAWSLTLAARTFHLSIFAYLGELGYAFLFANMLRAGCIWNDILDRDYDRQVERTKNRPIANGSVSVPGALVFLFFHLAFLVAMLQPLNHLARKIGLSAIFVFPGVYPLMKRITYWPQAWLGITMNIGIPLAWAAVTETCPPSIFIFLVGAWAWSIWYDTIYACQDKKDDTNAGVKSTALLFGDNIKTILALFGLVVVGSFIVAGYLTRGDWAYFVFSIIGGSIHLVWQLSTVDLDDPCSCWITFTRNGYSFGFLIYFGLLVDYIYAMYNLL